MWGSYNRRLIDTRTGKVIKHLGGNSISRYSSNVSGVQADNLATRKNRQAAIAAAPRPSTASTGLSYAGAAGNMKAEWQKAYDAAKAANKARENELRKKYQARYSAVMQGLQGMGDQTRKDILERGRRREGEAAQSAISRGLSMGTIVDSLQNSVREGTDRSIGQLDESLRNTKLGYESSLRKDEADFIERITDQYPDQRMYANMFQQYGQGQAGAGQAGYGGMYGNAIGGSGIGHAFYQGTDPVTGRMITSRVPTGRYAASLHQNSISSSFKPRGKNESYHAYQMRRKAAGLPYRSGTRGSSMSGRARRAKSTSRDRAQNIALSKYAPVRSYYDSAFASIPSTIPESQLPKMPVFG